jgi:hypothetical protein
LEKRLAKRFENVIDFNVEFVRLLEWAPSVEYRVCDFQNTSIDFRIGGGESADEVLQKGRFRVRRRQ